MSMFLADGAEVEKPCCEGAPRQTSLRSTRFRFRRLCVCVSAWCFGADEGSRVGGERKEKGREFSKKRESSSFSRKMVVPTRFFDMRHASTKKFQPEVKTTGLVEYRVSPYELQLFGDWKDPAMIYRKFKRNVVEKFKFLGPCILGTYLMTVWANKKHDEIMKSHRY